jgi:hypothetical protein
MTQHEAREILVPPLRFGDARQIAAVELLERVEILQDAIRRHDVVIFRCGECTGDGWDDVTCWCVDANSLAAKPDCPHCHGTGITRAGCELCNATGYELAEFDDGTFEEDPYVIVAAVAANHEQAEAVIQGAF